MTHWEWVMIGGSAILVVLLVVVLTTLPPQRRPWHLDPTTAEQRLRHWDEETARREIDRELARRDVPHCRTYTYQPHDLGGYAVTCWPAGQRGLSYHIRP